MGQVASLGSFGEVSLLGIAGLRVVLVWEFVDERHVVVETAPSVEHCRECGQRAESGGRPTVHVRDLPAAGKAGPGLRRARSTSSKAAPSGSCVPGWPRRARRWRAGVRIARLDPAAPYRAT